MEWNGTLNMRVASKKNSKRVFLNRATGKPVVTSSQAFATFHDEAVFKLRTQRPHPPIDQPFECWMSFELKGKMDADLDNLQTSILDVLTDAGVIADDALCVHLDTRKRLGCSDFKTDIRILTV